MTSIFDGRKRRISNSERLDIKDFLQCFLEELRSKESRSRIHKDYRIRTISDAERIKALINSPSLYFNTAAMIQSEKDNWQEVCYRQSNLGHGFVFFFLCVGCECPARHLYRVSTIIRYRCRVCLNLGYYKPVEERYQKPKPLGEIFKEFSAEIRAKKPHIFSRKML